MSAITKLILKYLRLSSQIMIPLGERNQKGSLVAALEVDNLWGSEPLRTKIGALIKRHYEPGRERIEKAATQAFMQEIFGGEDDYAEGLFRIMAWHNSRDWDFDELLDSDQKKVSGLRAMSMLCTLQYRDIYSPYLNLKLAKRAPMMCVLLHPIVAKIPVVTVRYYLDLHAEFAFNSIRKSKHLFADDLISYLYEIQFIQQKIALSMLEMLELTTQNQNEKKENLLTRSEVSAIRIADLVFSYLKASIEKVIVLIGLIYGISNLDAKKQHKDKLKALDAGLPNKVKAQYYWAFISEFISADHMNELNSYRSGLLHKRGISDLQPHNYVGVNAFDVPLLKIFFVLQEQHSRNTGILLGALALLTDELIQLDPPGYGFAALPQPTDDFIIRMMEQAAPDESLNQQ